jgi:hypothetical protein
LKLSESQQNKIVAPLKHRDAWQKFYAIADARVRLQAADVWAAQLVENFLQGFHFHPAPNADYQTTSYTLSLKCETPAPEIPFGLEAFEILDGHCHTDGENYYFEVCDSLIHIHPPASRLAEVWFGATTRARLSRSLSSVLLYAVQSALRRCGLLQFHGAAVIEPVSGAGFLFAGDSGCGKSTLALQMAAAGWLYLSDDNLLLGRVEDSAMAYALRCDFAVVESSIRTDASAQLLAALGAHLENDESKVRLDPTRAFPESFAASCTPRALFFPQIVNEQQSRIEKLSQGAAMSRLITHCPWAAYDAAVAHEHLHVLSLLVKQSSAYELFTGRDLLEDPQSVANFLASHLS